MQLDNEIVDLDNHLKDLVDRCAPELVAVYGVGADTAATLLVAAGDNPERFRNEQSFAALCGVSPVDRSSGKQRNHSLNRGGNREANKALWRIALVRMRYDPTTRASTYGCADGDIALRLHRHSSACQQGELCKTFDQRKDEMGFITSALSESFGAEPDLAFIRSVLSFLHDRVLDSRPNLMTLAQLAVVT